MTLGASAWIVMPLVGAAIGYLTNRLAVKMIFRPLEPRRVLGITVHGLIARRQSEIASSIGRVVGDHLVRHEDLVAAVGQLDVEQLVDRAIERGMSRKVEELRKVPLLGGLLTEGRVKDLRQRIVRSVVRDSQGLVEEFERAVEEGLDVRGIVTRKVAEFPVERLEALILEVASRELRAIELLGGALGFAVGLAQAGLMAWLA